MHVASLVASSLIALSGIARATDDVRTPSVATELAQTRLLIVAPDAWVDALNSFAQSKRSLPWIASCDVVSLKSLCQGHAGDEAEQLKRGLFSRWNRVEPANTSAHDFDAVLLVGDTEVMPIRFMMLDRATTPAFDVAFYPCDLYFADLTDESGAFDDWNARVDGHHARYIGEVHGESAKDGPIDADGCQLVPEISIGRWPVSTLDELNGVIAKAIAHDRATLTSRSKDAAARKVELVACGGWIDNAARIEGVARSMEPAFAVQRMFYSDTDASRHPDPTRVIEALAQGRALILHTGHGQPHGWEHGLQAKDLARTSGQKSLAVLLSIGCSTAEISAQPPYTAYLDADGVSHVGTNSGEIFSAPPPPPACRQSAQFGATSLGEASVRMPDGGAIAYIGCVTGSQPCAHTLLDGFAEFVGAHPTTSIGAAWKFALTRYVRVEHLATLKPTSDWYPPSVYFQPMKFVLLGDPSVVLR